MKKVKKTMMSGLMQRYSKYDDIIILYIKKKQSSFYFFILFILLNLYRL